jgi:hypothetical protein
MPLPSSRPGRRPDPASSQRWQQRLQRFRDSGLTVAAFCEREGISAASSYAWRRRLQHDPTLLYTVVGTCKHLGINPFA